MGRTEKEVEPSQADSVRIYPTRKAEVIEVTTDGKARISIVSFIKIFKGMEVFCKSSEVGIPVGRG